MWGRGGLLGASGRKSLRGFLLFGVDFIKGSRGGDPTQPKPTDSRIFFYGSDHAFPLQKASVFKNCKRSVFI